MGLSALEDHLKGEGEVKKCGVIGAASFWSLNGGVASFAQLE